MDEHRHRPHDHLVEPLFAGLGHEPPAARRRLARVLLALLLLLAALGWYLWA